MGRHLLFYDGHCGLCDGAVRFLARVDKKQHFLFAPLDGNHAQRLLANLSDEDRSAESFILLEEYSTAPRCYLYGKAALRIAWLLGGPWRLVGLFHFLPSCLYNWVYRFIARHRYSLFGLRACTLQRGRDARFLD